MALVGFCLDKRVVLALAGLLILYAATLQAIGRITSSTLVYLAAVASLATPLVALAFSEAFIERPGRKKPALARALICPSLAVAAALAAAVSLAHPQLLGWQPLWMQIILLSLQTVYQSTVLIVAGIVAGLGRRGRVLTAIAVFLVYPLILVIIMFPREVDTAREMILARLPLALAHPSLLFSPDVDYYTATSFTAALLYTLLAVATGLLFIRTSVTSGGHGSPRA